MNSARSDHITTIQDSHSIPMSTWIAQSILQLIHALILTTSDFQTQIKFT